MVIIGGEEHQHLQLELEKIYNSNRTSVYKYGSVHCNNSLKNWGNNRSI